MLKETLISKRIPIFIMVSNQYQKEIKMQIIKFSIEINGMAFQA